MKKHLLAILVISLFTGKSIAQDKSFEKGTITASFGASFAIYKTKSHSEITNYLGTVTVQDTTDGAGSAIYSLSGEYGVTDWFGAGVRFGYSNYIEETKHDTVYNVPYTYKPKVSSYDLDFVFNFHFIKTKRFDMPVSILIGYSHFKYFRA